MESVGDSEGETVSEDCEVEEVGMTKRRTKRRKRMTE